MPNMTKEIEPTENKRMPNLGCRDWIARFYDKMPVCVIEANVVGISASDKKQPVRLPCQLSESACVVENIPRALKAKYEVEEESQEAKEARALNFLARSGLGIGARQKKKGGE